MATQITWSINDMVRNTADDGVTSVEWSCYGVDSVETDCTAYERGVINLTPDSSAANFIQFEDLAEETVLAWVRNHLETSEGFSTTEIEKRLGDIITSLVTAKAEKVSGLPWA